MHSDLLVQLQQLISFEPDDIELVQELALRVRPKAETVITRFYERLLENQEARHVFDGGTEQLVRQRQFLTDWLHALLEGDCTGEGFARLIRVGKTHVQTGVPQRLMVAGIELIRQEIAVVLDAEPDGTQLTDRRALDKLLALNLAAMLESYKESYETLVRSDERRVVEERLTRAEHLAEIGQLAASLAHEIKNPLAGISGAIQIIRESMPKGDPHRPILTEVLGQIRRLDATVKDLLQYARPVPPRLKRCSVGTVINRVVALLREEPALQERRIEHDGASKDIVVMADENQFEQLLINLVINAAHASRAGDRINVETVSMDSCVQLSIRDFGIGMAEDVRAQAFEPFFTTKAKGTGLGLSICRRIVESHGGDISIESALGAGTTVTIRWPTVHPGVAAGAVS